MTAKCVPYGTTPTPSGGSLLEEIKAQLATMNHPFDKQETRASIIITIRDILWKGLPESYSDESINYYRDAVYNYVSQHYGS